MARRPRAAATGSKKRRVLPLSRQSSRRGAAGGPAIGVTSRLFSRSVKLVPICRRQSMVASRSPEAGSRGKRVSPWAIAARIRARCPSDLESGTAARRRAFPGQIVISIGRAPFFSSAAAGIMT